MNFLTKHGKAFYYAYGILIGVVIILGVFYASQYYDVRVAYSIVDGKPDITSDTADNLNIANNYLYSYFSNGNANGLVAATGFSTNFNDYAMTVYDFQKSLSSVNDLIISFGVASLVVFALLLVLSNHNRRIYYKSNLIGGIILPLVVVVLFTVLLVKNFEIMGMFNNNLKLFDIVNVLMGTNRIENSKLNYEGLSALFNLNSLTFVLYTLLFVIVIAYSVFMAIYAFLKYKATAEERAEIEKKAVAHND